MLLGAGGLVGLAALALWMWAIVDCITADASECRNLHKGVWLVIVIVLVDIGAILWILLGRPTSKRWAPTPGTDAGTPRRPVGLEDRADFGAPVTDRRSADLDRLLAEWEARGQHPSETQPPIGDERVDDLAVREADLARREEELRRRELELGDRDPGAREREVDED